MLNHQNYMDNTDFKSKNGIKFVHINVRSILKKLDEIAFTYNHVDLFYALKHG